MLIRMIVCAALMLSLSLAASADAVVTELLVRTEGGRTSEINIRTDVTNPGDATQSGPINVELLVRRNSDQQWRHVYSYPPIDKIPAHQHIARDYFIRAPVSDPVLSRHHFQIMARVTLPDGTTTQKVRVHNGP